MFRWGEFSAASNPSWDREVKESSKQVVFGITFSPLPGVKLDNISAAWHTSFTGNSYPVRSPRTFGFSRKTGLEGGCLAVTPPKSCSSSRCYIPKPTQAACMNPERWSSVSDHEYTSLLCKLAGATLASYLTDQDSLVKLYIYIVA